MSPWKCLLIASLGLLVGCTPNHTREQSRGVAEEVRLLDDVEIQRGHHRRISRQARICLVADGSLRQPEVSLSLAQQALAAEFAAVGIERQAFSYLEMIEVLPCPTADYLFHISALCSTDCSADPLSIRIAQADGSRFDHVQMTLQGGWWRFGSISAAQRQAAFTRLARELVSG